MTNFVQCYDVPLATNDNFITLRMADVAGNTTTTNFDLVLDYTGATNPPAIQLDWPAEGVQIGQSNMTVYGTLDDPTATISLQVTDDAGDTNVIAGVVERDGHFWIQNVPLAGTTDVLTLTVQDVVSNTSTMNLTVYPANDAGLTMDPVPSDLWDSTATVTGTIADDSYAVTVNGVSAVNNGDGTWTADGVPVSGGNTAVFTAQAVTPDETIEVQAAAIKPAALKLAGATLSDDLMNGQNFFGYGYTDEIQTSWNWMAGRGGSWQQTDTIVLQPGSVPIATTWNNAPIRADGSVPYETSTDSAGDCWTNGFSGGPWQSDFPQEVGALAAIGQTPPGWWDVRSGYASWVLHAGNLDVSGGQNPDSLVVLSATAMEEVQGSGAEGSGGIVSGPNELGPEIDNTGKQEDTSYQMALIMQDGTERSSTVTTDRLLNSVVNSTDQYKPVISWVDGPVITNTQNVIVGQQISLSCALVGLPGSTPPPITNYSWTVPGYAVSNFYCAPDLSTGMVIEPFPKTTNETDFYWVDGGTKQISCTVQSEGIPLVAQTSFNVLRPAVNFIGAINGLISYDSNFAFGTGESNLHFGGSTSNGIITHGIDCTASNPNVVGCSDYGFTVVQVITQNSHTDIVAGASYIIQDGTGLDTFDPLADLGHGYGTVYSDSPGISISNTNVTTLSKSGSYQTVLMFQPFGVNSISVPIKEIDWNWSGAGTFTNGQWVLASSPTNAAITLNNHDTTTFLQWTNVVITGAR